MPKLTLRDLFAVVTIAALALVWWLDRSYQSSTRRENHVLRLQLEAIKEELERYGADVTLKKNGVAISTADGRFVERVAELRPVIRFAP